MYNKKKISGSAIMCSVFIIVMDSVKSEWIDIPQFSDESRVYRVPIILPQKHYIPFNKSYNSIGSTSTNFTEGKISLRETMRVPQNLNFETTTLFYIPENADDISGNSDEKQEPPSINSNDDLLNNSGVEGNSANSKSQIFMNCNRKNNDTIGSITLIEQHKFNIMDGKKTDATGRLAFLQYFPINLIQRVHTILLGNTQMAIQDKRNYLQQFRTSLLNKLESGLTPLFHYVRKKRTSDWDDDHDHVGFPSLEGALLAISFLTFAVYLVQLVMMLLRNLANNGTLNTNTVLVNRNKRSLHQFSEESIRILEYLETFSNN